MKIEIYEDALPQPRPRFGKGGKVYQKITAYKTAVSYAAKTAMAGNATTAAPLAVSLKFYRRYKPHSRRFGDVDNLAKSCLDSSRRRANNFLTR